MRRRGSLAPTVAPNMARSFILIMLPVMIKLKTRMMAIIKRIALPYFEDGCKIGQNLRKKKSTMLSGGVLCSALNQSETVGLGTRTR